MGIMERQFIVHAGTHKTASTYVQDRLWENRKILHDQGVRLLKPRKRKTGQFKEFAEFLKGRNYSAMEAELSRITADDQHVIVSAEQFTQPLTNESNLEGLRKLVGRFGFQLRIVVFLRDQPDYINSLYVQEVRRFYHSRDLPSFTKRCRKRRSHWFNYESMFSHLLANELITAKFLPFGSVFGDPFINFIDSTGLHLPGRIDWLQGRSGKSNDQPGIKGVWLALQVCRRMQQIGVDLKLLENQSKYIRKYSIPRGWSEDRFFGMRPKKVEKIRKFYKESNDRFAQRVWGKNSWADVYEGLKPQVFNVMDESMLAESEREEMNDLVERVFLDIKAANPLAFPVA